MNPEDPIRVLVVDDHRMVRNGLIILIKDFDDLELVGEASNGEEAISLCQTLRPDVVLMDVVMPVLDGIEATRRIREVYPQIQVIALTSFTDRTHIQGVIQAGAIGYLLKDASIDEVVEAIRLARSGKATLDWKVAQVLVEGSITSESQHIDLTDREREVLALMSDGLTNRQIAGQLQLSPYTINAHVRSILSKIGVSNRVEAVLFARDHRLLD